MSDIYNKRPLFKVGLIGLLIFPFLIGILALSPPADKAPAGYSSVILPFEFASNEQELEAVLSPLTSNEIIDLDNLNKVDFGFMIAYGVFLFMFMTRFGEIIGSGFLNKVRWIALAAVLYDFLENMQLLKLSSFKMGDNIGSSLDFLAIFTWGKWLLLAVAFVCIASKMLRMSLWSKVAGVFLVIPIVMGVPAFVTNNPRIEDAFGSSVFIGFFVLFLYCFLYRKPEQLT